MFITLLFLISPLIPYFHLITGSHLSEIVCNPVHLPLSYVRQKYVTTLSLGTPPQQFQFHVRSRNREIWIKAANCTRPNCPVFNPSASKTYNLQGQYVQSYIGSIDQSYYGYMSKETFHISGRSIKNVLFGAMTEAPFVDNIILGMDPKSLIPGVLGLGFRPKKHFGFLLDYLIPNQGDRVAAFYLKRINDTDDIQGTEVEDAGHVTLGSRTGDESLYEGDIHWIKGMAGLNGDKQIPVRDISLDNGFKLCSNDNESTKNECYNAVIDVNSPKIELPGILSLELNRKLFNKTEGPFTALCRDTHLFPNVTFNFGSYKVSIPPSDYLMPHRYEETRLWICTSQFQEWSDNFDSKISLGLPFLYNAHTLFDYDKKRIGFAKYKTGVLNAYNSAELCEP